MSNQIQSPNLTANFHGRAISSIAFQDQNQWTQNWSLTPVTDFSDLERLRDLYRLAILLTPNDDATNTKLIQDFGARYVKTQVKGLDSSTQQLANLVTPVALTGANAAGVSVAQAPLPVPPMDIIVNADMTQWRYPLPSRKWVYWALSSAPPIGYNNVGKFGGHQTLLGPGCSAGFSRLDLRRPRQYQRRRQRLCRRIQGLDRTEFRAYHAVIQR